jgi:hypothetical protein
MTRIKLEGENRRGREIKVDLEIISLKEKHNECTVVRWTDGKSASFSGGKVWRHYHNSGLMVLLKDITKETYC